MDEILSNLFDRSISKRSSYIPGGYICINYEDINRAVSEAKMMLGIYSAPYEVKQLSSDSPKAGHISKVAEILLQASAILARMHGLSKEAILYGLPRVDTYKTAIRDLCPTFLKPVKCEVSKYRTLSGMCNNLQYPSWGSSRSAMLRLLPPDYADGECHLSTLDCSYHLITSPLSRPRRHPGLTEPRVAKSGQPLPPPRLVSIMLHQDVADYDHEVTYLVVAWGQMLDHDLTFAAMPKGIYPFTVVACRLVSMFVGHFRFLLHSLTFTTRKNLAFNRTLTTILIFPIYFPTNWHSIEGISAQRHSD